MLRTDFYNVVFTNTNDGTSTSIQLYSHYTCVYGYDSGEGKTKFIDFISRGMSTGELKIDVVSPFGENAGFALMRDDVLTPLLEVATRRFIYIVDEATMFKSGKIKDFNNSMHLFIVVSRGFPFKIDVPVHGMYKIIEKDRMFEIEKLQSLPIATDFSKKFDNVVVEGNIEENFYSKLFPVSKNSKGSSNIEKHLRHIEGSCLVFMDLGNIAKQYALLMKRCEGKDIQFYDYLCFEHLLYDSKLVRDTVSRETTLTFVDKFTLEAVYEAALEYETKGTALAYKHGMSKLQDAYFDNLDALLDSDVASGIREYIETNKKAN